jgi:hypothetical protein
VDKDYFVPTQPNQPTMKSFLSNAGLLTVLLLSLSACDYFCDCENPTMPCLFAYDQVSYTPTGGGGEQLVNPVFEGDQPAGTFSAQLAGLVIDSLSGAIDVNASEAGEYTVVYTLDDEETVCETKVVIGEGPIEIKECVLSYEGNVGELNYYIPFPGTTQLAEPTFADDTKPDGIFTVEPQGLDLNPNTGAFDVNSSESGVVYTVTYTSEDKLTICQVQVTVAGFDYQDTIVDVSADQAIVVPTATQREGRSSNGERFVEVQEEQPLLVFSDIEGEPQPPGSISSTGSIDLKATLQLIDRIIFQGNGGEPVINSGYSRRFTVRYIYEEEGGEIQVESDLEFILYWYPTIDVIPEELRELVNYKGQFANGRAEDRPNHMVSYGKY